jgi:hypothetical protein
VRVCVGTRVRLEQVPREDGEWFKCCDIGLRCGDSGGYRRDNHGQKIVQGSSMRNVEINKQMRVCEDSRDLCALIDARTGKLSKARI